MHDLTDNQQAEAAREGLDGGRVLIAFYEFVFGGITGTKYWAGNVYDVDPAVQTEAALLAFPTIGISLDVTAKANIVGASAEVILRNDDNSIGAIFDQVGDPEGTRVNEYTVFSRKDGVALVQADWRLGSQWVIDSYPDTDQAEVRVTLVDVFRSSGRERFGREISRDLFPTQGVPDKSWGKTIPYPWGSIEDFPCYPVDIGYSAVLAGAIDDDTDILFVDTVERAPSSGRVAIGAEFVDYIGAVAATGTTGAFLRVAPNGRGADGTEATAHGDGEIVREDVAEYRWIVADTDRLWNVVDKTIKGDTAIGSAVVQNLDFSTAILVEGDAVSGVGIPVDTTVLTIDAVDEVTLSANATANGSQVDLRFRRTARGKLGGKTVSSLALVEDLNGSNATYLVGDSIPQADVVDTAARDTDFGGDTPGWDDGGESSCESIYPNGATLATTGTWSAASALITGLGVDAEVELLPGMSILGEGIPGDATIKTIDSASQVTMTEDATAPGSGASVSFTGNIFPNTARAGVDGGDQRQTSFVLLTPEEAIEGDGGNRTMDLDYSRDLSGRINRFKRFFVEFDYRVIPNRSLSPGAPEFSWGNPKFQVLRGGVVVLERDVGRPSEAVMTGRLDELALRPRAVTAGPDDFKLLFGNVSDVPEQVAPIYVSGYTSEKISVIGDPARFFFFRTWVGYSGVDEKGFIPNSLSEQSVGTIDLDETYNEIDMRAQPIVFGIGGLTQAVYGNVRIRIGVSVPNKATNPGFTRVIVGATMDGVEVEGGGQVDVGEGSSRTIDMAFNGEFTLAQINSLRVSVGPKYYSGAFGGAPNGVLNRIDELSFFFNSLSVDVVLPSDLLGGRKDPVFEEEDVTDQGIVSATPIMTQPIDLTGLILGDPEFAENRWLFADGTLSCRLIADSESTPTEIAVFDTRIVAEEYIVQRRTLSDDQLTMLIDLEGVWAAEPVRAGAWVGPAMIDRIEDVIPDYLENIMGMDLADVDLSSTDFGGLLKEVEDRQHWRLAGALDQPRSKRDWLGALCMSSYLRPVADGTLRFMGSLMASASDSVATMDDESALIRPVSFQYGGRGTRVTEARMYYKADYKGDREFVGRHFVRDETAIEGLGFSQSEPYQLEFIREDRFARECGELIVNDLADRLQKANVVANVSQAALQACDIVSIESSVGGVARIPGRIVGREFAAVPRGEGAFDFECRFAILMPGEVVRVWTHDTSTYIEAFRSNGEMHFVIEDVLVAVLRKGRLQIKGVFREVAPAGTQTEIIEKVGTSIWLALEIGGPPRTRLAEFTKTGDVKAIAFGESGGLPIKQTQAEYFHEFSPTPTLQVSSSLRLVDLEIGAVRFSGRKLVENGV